MATRSLLDRDGTAARQDDHASLDTPATHDFPLPSRSLRLGLGSDISALTADNVSTTELMLPADESLDGDDAPTPAAESAQQSAKPKHRLQAPPTALRARTALFAIAAGATAMAVSGSAGDGQPSPIASTPAPAPVDGDAVAPAANVSTPTDPNAPRIVGSEATTDMSEYDSQLTVGTAHKKAVAAAEAAKRKPMFVSPIPIGAYHLTSAYAPRWGSFHGGLDFAAPLGTPIHAVTDGVVKKAGSASGYGNWVVVEAADGTMTMYGHMSSSGVLVHPGQKVTAGDTIALVGSEGFSTGPHVHFEVWVPKGGQMMKIDPAPWLAKKGVKLSTLEG